MTLAELTTLFKAKTGRLDLADADIARIINEASVLLDQLDVSIGRASRFYASTVIGSAVVMLPLAYRWLDVVSVIADGLVNPLCEATSEAVRNANVDSSQGTPAYFAKLTSLVSGSLPVTPADYPSVAQLSADPTLSTSYLLVSPVPDAIYTIEVLGTFYSPTITALVINKWAALWPSLLIETAEYILTKDLLNIEESAKIIQSIQSTINLIVFDSISDERISEMGG